MLSSVLSSKAAIEINMSIMRAFVAMRNYLNQHADTSREIAQLWQHIRSLEERREENLRAINDLSEDTQSTLDEIYIVLAELAKKQQTTHDVKLRQPVGYVKPKE